MLGSVILKFESHKTMNAVTCVFGKSALAFLSGLFGFPIDILPE